MTHPLMPFVLAAAMYRPPFGVLVIVLFVALAGLTLIVTARRERARWTAALRIAGLAGLAWVLLGHSRTQPIAPNDTDPPNLRILIDTSASMGEKDASVEPDGPAVSRLDALSLTWLTADRLGELQRFADVELVAFDQRLGPAPLGSLSPDGKETQLLRALAQTRADATLVLSDGHETTTPDNSAPQSTTAGRVYAVPVGAPRSAPDLALQAWPDSDRLFEEQATTITATVRSRGFGDVPGVVELLHNGEAIERRALPSIAGQQTLRFEVRPTLEPGQTTQAHHYTARVRLSEGDEAYTENNAQDLFIQVSRGEVRVLLIEGEPYWDTRSLARLIAGHPRFDLTALYGFGDDRRSRIIGETPDAADDPAQQLDAYDIVILGRRAERLVNAGFAQRLDAFVRGGGAVVFARGRPFDPASPTGRALLSRVEPISPVAWGEPVVGAMRVRLGDASDGRGPLDDLRDEAVLSRLPGMLAATQIDGRKTASLVMLEQSTADSGPGMAALTTLRVGSGVVMAVLTEGLWRWELLPGIEISDAQTESIYGVFWIRALQWLASGGEFLPGQDIAIEADRLGPEPGEAVNLRVSTRYIEAGGLDLELGVTGPGGENQPLVLTPGATPGTYNAAFTPSDPGVYRFALTTPGRDDLVDPAQPLMTRIAVVDRSPERRDTSAQPDRLKQLTEATGGRCLGPDEPGPLIDYLQSLQALRGMQESVDYDFNSWPAFLWIAGCFGIEWILRRRSGLR